MQPDYKKIKQPVIWEIHRHDGSVIKEYNSECKETIFDMNTLMEDHKTFRYLCLRDLVNGIIYSIDLITGEFILNRVPIRLGKEIEGRMINLSGLPNTNYKRGIIQYKESYPIPYGAPIKAEPKSFNIGYKVDVPKNICSFNKNGCLCTVSKIMALISINATDLKPTIATTLTCDMKMKDGRVISMRY